MYGVWCSTAGVGGTSVLLIGIVAVGGERPVTAPPAAVLPATECRAMHGKAVVKGEADIRCLALQEDGAVRVLSSQTPFTQIWDLPDAEDGGAADPA